MADEHITLEQGYADARRREDDLYVQNQRYLNMAGKIERQQAAQMSDGVTPPPTAPTSGRIRFRPTGASGSAEAAIDSAASAQIEKGYGMLWDRGQSMLAGFSTSFWGLLSLVTIVPLGFIYFARLIGKVFGRVSWRGVSVHVVPNYSILGLSTQTYFLLLNVVMVMMWLVVIIIIITILNEQTKLWCTAFGPIVNYFQNNICSAVTAATG